MVYEKEARWTRTTRRTLFVAAGVRSEVCGNPTMMKSASLRARLAEDSSPGGRPRSGVVKT